MKKIAAVFMVLSVLSPLGLRSAFAEDEMVLSRLRAIEKKQDQILQAMEGLKSEIEVVKIRISSQ